jgi:hypothetical protein
MPWSAKSVAGFFGQAPGVSHGIAGALGQKRNQDYS